MNTYNQYNEIEKFKDNNVGDNIFIQKNKNLLNKGKNGEHFENKLIPILNKKRKREKYEKVIVNN